MLAILIGLPLSKLAPLPELKPLPQFTKCIPGKKRTSTTTRVVDGDTLWLRGQNIRLMGFDTLEAQTAFCAENEELHMYETHFGQVATQSLSYLLNHKEWTIEYFGPDRSGTRRLATIRINGKDAGDQLLPMDRSFVGLMARNFDAGFRRNGQSLKARDSRFSTELVSESLARQ